MDERREKGTGIFGVIRVDLCLSVVTAVFEIASKQLL
jgi:hypothetical protein